MNLVEGKSEGPSPRQVRGPVSQASQRAFGQAHDRQQVRKRYYRCQKVVKLNKHYIYIQIGPCNSVTCLLFNFLPLNFCLLSYKASMMSMIPMCIGTIYYELLLVNSRTYGASMRFIYLIQNCFPNFIFVSAASDLKRQAVYTIHVLYVSFPMCLPPIEWRRVVQGTRNCA